MIHLTPYQPADLLGMDSARLLGYGSILQHPQYAQALARGEAFTGRAPSGLVLGCAGLIADPASSERWLWAFLARETGPYMMEIHRAVRRFLAITPGPLYSMAVSDYRAGCRWLSLLGFEPRERTAVYLSGDVIQHTVYARG